MKEIIRNQIIATAKAMTAKDQLTVGMELLKGYSDESFDYFSQEERYILGVDILKLAAQNGQARAYYFIGYYYEFLSEKEDDSLALKNYLIGANEYKDSFCIATLADSYNSGSLGLNEDEEKAKKFFKEVYPTLLKEKSYDESGFAHYFVARTQLNLAINVENSNERDKLLKSAFACLKIANEKNVIMSDYLLGSFYANGVGTEKNLILAKKHLTNAKTGSPEYKAELIKDIDEELNLSCSNKKAVDNTKKTQKFREYTLSFFVVSFISLALLLVLRIVLAVTDFSVDSKNFYFYACNFLLYYWYFLPLMGLTLMLACDKDRKWLIPALFLVVFIIVEKIGLSFFLKDLSIYKFNSSTLIPIGILLGLLGVYCGLFFIVMKKYTTWWAYALTFTLPILIFVYQLGLLVLGVAFIIYATSATTPFDGSTYESSGSERSSSYDYDEDDSDSGMSEKLANEINYALIGSNYALFYYEGKFRVIDKYNNIYNVSISNHDPSDMYNTYFRGSGKLFKLEGCNSYNIDKNEVYGVEEI